MKIFYLTIVLFFGATINSFSQCEEQYLDTCKRHLQEDHYVFLKSCSLSNEHGAKDKVEFSYALVKGKKYEYYFDGYKEGQQEVIATLYDENRKKLATSVHHNQYEHKLVFTCQKSGIYYIEFTFRDKEEYCGVASLGFSNM